jgi:hypothetical protein
MCGTMKAKMSLHVNLQKPYGPQSASTPTMQRLQYHGTAMNQEAQFFWPLKYCHHKEIIPCAWVRM